MLRSVQLVDYGSAADDHFRSSPKQLIMCRVGRWTPQSDSAVVSAVVTEKTQVTLKHPKLTTDTSKNCLWLGATVLQNTDKELWKNATDTRHTLYDDEFTLGNDAINF